MALPDVDRDNYVRYAVQTRVADRIEHAVPRMYLEQLQSLAV